MSVFLPLVLAMTVFMLVAAAVESLVVLGPVGWVLSVLLVLGVLQGLRWCWRVTRAWWASTRAPELPVSAGRDRVPAAPRERHGGSSPG